MANEKNLKGVLERLDDLVDDLESRLTAGRAGNLDEITSARLGELDAANIPADVDSLLTRLTSARAAALDDLPWTTITSDTHAHASGTGNQTVFEVLGITTPVVVVAILDLANATTDKRIRVREKVDGSTYRIVDPQKNWTTSDQDAVRIEFTALDDYEVVLGSVSDEGGPINVPYKHARRGAS